MEITDPGGMSCQSEREAGKQVARVTSKVRQYKYLMGDLERIHKLGQLQPFVIT